MVETSAENGKSFLSKSRACLALLIISLCFLVAHGLYSARVNSVTVDEYVHLPTAIAIAQKSDFEMDHFGSPPLRALLAVPALGSDPKMDYGSAYYKNKEFYAFSWLFMKDNFKAYHSLFVKARVMPLLLAVLLCVMIYVAAGEVFGKGAAVFAAVLFCFNPETLAHSSLATVDMLTACFFLPVFISS